MLFNNNEYKIIHKDYIREYFLAQMSAAKLSMMLTPFMA